MVIETSPEAEASNMPNPSRPQRLRRRASLSRAVSTRRGLRSDPDFIVGGGAIDGLKDKLEIESELR
jgi:hypothetical protein